MITLYNLLLFLAVIIGFPLIVPLIILSDKRRKTFLQRLGLKPAQECRTHKSETGKRIWIHALSVGEVLSALPLVEKLTELFGCRNIIFSASTRTGFEIANSLLKGKTQFVFFFPYDLLFSVKIIANRIKPDLVIIVETDIWPNFLFEMESRKVPVILVNARLSERSFRGFRRFLFFTKPLFAKFRTICTQTAEDARRFALLGLHEKAILITGNIKFDQADSQVTDTEIRTLRESLNIAESGTLIVAGSTHEGEEQILSAAFLQLKKLYPDNILLIVPRDPARGISVCRLFRNSGFSAVTLSESKEILSDSLGTDVIVIDRIGLLRKLYALADIAFVGGSLLPFGGHNPLEPAAFSKPILFGPYMSDFKEIAAMLRASGGALQVCDAESFYKAATEFLEDKLQAQYAGRLAAEVFYANKGAVEKTVNLIETCLK
jgi:3-deoxy-D-manno-octulosonic-acid transferase